ncbi:rho GTPase-activating protein 32-like protein [Lates japonicus]|uniref:Rho GTPase-activating protein 32-like protein n=1 Tax=Lates japonicus TaxID=270547 RepID=A0AAD3RP28_LATJO|nr:rho GTPase-activating protein 32-like protein [Lates japonicus]
MEAGCVVAAVIENAASGPQGEPGSSDVLEGDVLPSTDLDKDDALPQATNSNPPEEKQPQETSTAMVRTDDITEHAAEPLLRSCVSTASMKVKNMKKLTFPRGHFPRLAECAHFHYETVDFGNVQLAFMSEGRVRRTGWFSDSKRAGLSGPDHLPGVGLAGEEILKLSVLDKHLHLCIYDP